MKTPAVILVKLCSAGDTGSEEGRRGDLDEADLIPREGSQPQRFRLIFSLYIPIIHFERSIQECSIPDEAQSLSLILRGIEVPGNVQQMEIGPQHTTFVAFLAATRNN